MRINNPYLITIVGRLGSTALWTLFRTVRVLVHTESVNPYDCSGEECYLYPVWHDSVLMASFAGKHRNRVALTSRHRDGEISARVVAGVGIKTVRGSSGPSGRRAALELIKLSETSDIVITPDGPRGPRRTMSRGIVYLAAKTRNAILPSAFACSNAWEAKGNWTSLTIPKPFSRVTLQVGKPIRVPEGAAEAEIDEYVGLVQQAMDTLQALAVRHVNRSLAEHTQAPQTDHLDKAA